MPAFARQMPIITLQIERHTKLCEPFNRDRRIFYDKFNGGSVIQSRTSDHRIFDMARKIVTGFKHRCNSALRPCCCAVGDGTLG